MAVEYDIEIFINDGEEIHAEEVTFKDYERYEIDLEEIDWDSCECLIPDELQLSFIPDDEAHQNYKNTDVNVTDEIVPFLSDKEIQTTPTYTCDNCKKNYKRISYFNK